MARGMRTHWAQRAPGGHDEASGAYLTVAVDRGGHAEPEGPLGTGQEQADALQQVVVEEGIDGGLHKAWQVAGLFIKPQGRTGGGQGESGKAPHSMQVAARVMLC